MTMIEKKIHDIDESIAIIPEMNNNQNTIYSVIKEINKQNRLQSL